MPLSTISICDLFKDLNEILKRDITKAIKNETEIEFGETFTQKSNHSESKISIQKFSFTSNDFPVVFNPGNGSVVEHKEIIPIKGDFDDSSSIYKIQNDSSEEVTNKSNSSESVEKEEKLSTKKSKDEKLISEASTQAILTNV